MKGGGTSEHWKYMYVDPKRQGQSISSMIQALMVIFLYIFTAMVGRELAMSTP